MKAAQSGDFDARIRRAAYLASAYPFAAEVLNCYRSIAEFQKHLYKQISAKAGAQSSVPVCGELRSNLDAASLRPHFPEFLSVIQRIAPAPVAQTAHRLAAWHDDEFAALLGGFWEFGSTSTNNEAGDHGQKAEPLLEFILRGFLQPYAEFLGARMDEPPLAAGSRVCPRCGATPLLGVLRPEGDGGKRRLMCSFCQQEWDFRRIFCPACGEEEEQKLPVYVAEQFPHIRVESCETCKFYLRTIDLTKNGNAVPLVDDLAAIPLSLWADERGYLRPQANFMGT
jgi:formate dehydrogenase maturation protein FdhE